MRWVIGDIHGMLASLRQLVAELQRRDQNARLLFVGDYVNRGPESRGVLDLLIELSSAGVARCARGNHDDLFDMAANGKSFAEHTQAPDRVAAFRWFVNFGLGVTLESYGVDWLDVEWVRHHPTSGGVAHLFSAVPEAHRQFIRALPPVIEDPDLFVAHAMWNPDDPDDDPPIARRLESAPELRRLVLWGRFGAEVTRRKRWRRTGYFGHTPVEYFAADLRGGRNVPIFVDRAVLVDTGAALGHAGRLSAVCAETGEVVQVDRTGDLLPPELLG